MKRTSDEMTVTVIPDTTHTEPLRKRAKLTITEQTDGAQLRP